MANISKDSPLSEITFRRYEKPFLKDRELVRKFVLSLGLLQPGDSRDVIVDVLYVFLKNRKEMTSQEVTSAVIELRKERNLVLLGVADSNIRRQLRRLRESYLIEKKYNHYRINEWLSMKEIWEEKIAQFLIPSILDRVKDYCKAIDEEFKKEKSD